LDADNVLVAADWASRFSHPMVIATIKDTIRLHDMVCSGDRIVVAVSGGPDSVCLLSALHALSAELGISLHIAHLDHQFRGAESSEDAAFVAELSHRMSLPASIEKIDVPAYCRERGLSAQAGAREVRYAFLHRIARSVGASRIATGHTADDQAETLLMRIIRGAGTSGLAGIPPVRGSVIRPLIRVTRDDVLDYLRVAGLSSRSDSSNANTVYLRNRIRRDVLPLLRKFNPRIVETLAREASLLRDEDKALRALLDERLPAVCFREQNRVVIQNNSFSGAPPALKRRIMRHAAELAGRDPAGISSVRIEEALAFMAHAQSGRSMHLAPGIILAREYDRFLVTTAAVQGAVRRELAAPGVTSVPEFGLDVCIRGLEQGGAPSDKNYRWQAVFDYDKIRAPLTVRNRIPGDRFCPAGMGGRHKKVHDFFIDEKVPRLERDRVPLLCAGDDILWIIGYRTDERFLALGGTERRLTIGVSVRDANNG